MPRISTKVTGTGGSTTSADAQADHGAIGNGVADDRAALQSALDAQAGDDELELFLPPGRYLLGSALTSLAGNIRIVGKDATIKWDSTSFNALSFAAGASKVHIDGVTFEGNTTEDDYNINQGQALTFLADCEDITIRNCTFSWCRPLFHSANPGVEVGRTLIEGCRMLNCILPVSPSSNATISNCWFINDEMLGTRSHAVYVFGEVENVIITGCRFKNIDGNAIKTNNDAAYWEQKRGLVITGNLFEGGGSQCIWIGSDGDTNVTGVTIAGNTFRNTKSVHLHNVSDATINGNSLTWDWEATGAAGSVTGGIEVSSAIALGPMGPSRNVVVSGNVMRQRHPWVGKVTITSPPQDGATITVGSVTYTWRDTPVADTDIEVQDSASAAIQELNEMLRGRRTSPMNAVLRGPEDVLWEDNSGHTASPALYVASDATFALSVTGAGHSVTAAASKLVCTSAVHINETSHVKVIGNTFESFNYVYVTNSIEPVLERNTLINGTIDGRCNIRGTYDYNTFTFHRARDLPLTGKESVAWLRVSDGWPIIRGNKLPYPQHYTCPEMLGGSGVVTVSNGKGYADLFYGQEVATADDDPESIPFRWMDGDTVKIRDPYATVHTCTFKRVAPGANEFNSAATLMTWLGTLGGGGFSGAFVTTTNFSDDVWIRITHSVAADYGDNCYVQVTSRAQTCGQLLIDPDANAPANDRSYFRGSVRTGDVTGGDPLTGVTRTWVWTQLANKNAPPRVQGTTAAAQALNPIVYSADIEPGRGFYITHDASVTGTEKFAWLLEAP